MNPAENSCFLTEEQEHKIRVFNSTVEVTEEYHDVWLP